MRVPSLLVLLVMLVLGGCGASLRQRADEALQRRDYRKAAELYDQLAASHPDDRAILAKRTEARHGVLGELFGANQAARRNGDRARAIEYLGALLAQRDAWSMEIDPRLAPALAAEVGMAGNDIAIDVDHRTNTVGPLAGEQLLESHSALLGHAELGGRGRALAVRVREVGAIACARLATGATTPFWRYTVDRYCAHWGERDKVGTVELTTLRSELYVVGGVEGQSAGETEALERGLVDAFRASAWYAPTGARGVHTRLSGTVAISFTSRPITQHTTYDEEVPYTDYETSQESYQEPYTDTESYSEQVPYTETETRTEWCGTCSRGSHDCEPQVCTKSEPVTRYRTEWKTRTVTRYRTAWRTVTNPVTRYRTVTHPFDYAATEITGRYATTLGIRVAEEEEEEGAPAELVGVTASAQLADTRSGIEHDVSFAPAGVAPSRAELPSRAAVLDDQHAELQARLRAALDERYARLYCTRASYDREAAAACAYRDHASAPPAVHRALATVFGGDEPLLGAVLARPAADRIAVTRK